MENTSGITPLFEKVVVRPDEIEEKTEGGILIPDAVADNHQMAQATGILVAIGPDAFMEPRTVVKDSSGAIKEIVETGYHPEHTPKPGDRVQFARYGGLVNIGEDGKEYRVLNDRELTTLVTEGVTYTGIQSRKALGLRAQ